MFFAVVILFFAVLPACNAQDLTNLFFLHHSVGNGLVVEGNMRATVAAYNSNQGTHYGLWDHGYNYDGLRNPAGEETGINYEIPDDNTNPDGLCYLWTSSESQYAACRGTILTNHQVIAFKSCYPASHVPDEDTLNIYKSYYLAMRIFFDLHPEKLFVVMSPPPLHRLDTDDMEGYYARAFANWLKSNEYLAGHTNTVCFDLFGYLAGNDNFLNYNYESSHEGSDSHPNSLADQTVGPIFARFLIDSAAAYHSSTSSIPAPANVIASKGVYYDKVRVTWSAVSGAISYIVYRRDVAATTGLPSQIGITDTVSFNDGSAALSAMYYYWVKAQKSDGSTSLFSQPDTGWKLGVPATDNANRDLDGDRIMDLVVYCRTNADWDSRLSSNGQHGMISLGGADYEPALADFDGDTKADLCLYNASSGILMAALSGQNYQPLLIPMGGAGFVPEPMDYDGDGLADPAIYSASTGTWRVRLSTADYYEVVVPFGGSEYRAVPADYDGDAKTDPAICNEQSGIWTVECSARGYAPAGGIFGQGGRAVPADYDGDGLTDPAMYFEDPGLCKVWSSGTGYALVIHAIGGSGFVACPGDYDGDGLADPAAYNSITGKFRVLYSAGGYAQTEYDLGEYSSIPVGMPP